MKTAPDQLRSLKGRVAELAGDAEVSLPAAFVAGLIEDLEKAQADSEALEQFHRRLDKWLAKPPGKPQLRLVVAGGEES